MCVGISVTRWLDYFFNIWPFTTLKFFNSISKLPKNIQNCAKYLMEPFKICQWCFKFCHIGEISSNLVTLVSMSITYFKVMCVRISGERFRVSHR